MQKKKKFEAVLCEHDLPGKVDLFRKKEILASSTEEARKKAKNFLFPPCSCGCGSYEEVQSITRIK